MIKVETTNEKDGRVTKCVSCENTNPLGILRGFFSGQEASTSVIGTSLFEQLPSHEKKVHKSADDFDDGFGSIDEVTEEVNKAKQFLTFSDSRQAAAYFATYFSTTYDQFLFGKLIQETCSSLDKPTSMAAFVSKLASEFERNGIIPFDEYLERKKNNTAAPPDYDKLAWSAVLKELVGNRERRSLMGMGLLGIDFEKSIKFLENKKYRLSEEEIRGICLVFVLGMLSEASIDYPVHFTLGEKEYFAHKGIEPVYSLNAPSKYVKSFLPAKENGTNKRLDYLTKVLKEKNIEANPNELKTILEGIWKRFFAYVGNIPQIMKQSASGYRVASSALTVVPNKKWYRCDKCHHLTQVNIMGVCPSIHCSGHLHEVDVEKEEQNNHYFRLYHDLEPRPLRVVEHTAQLNREEGYFYQTLFKEQGLDVLSCSTTFEMGVDVGELETVFMRNMPPSTSNYAQRAGRAGRSAQSAAFALTFCNKSNHDFNYFKDPKAMIRGTILPPHFNIENEKIAIRHIYSSALSFFFKQYPDYFKDADTFMREIEGVSGFKTLKDYLQSKPKDLQEFLLRAFPPALIKRYKLDSFGWLDYLYGEPIENYPNLDKVKESYDRDAEIVYKELDKAKIGHPENIRYLNWRINTFQQEEIISFLSKNNILPKYGFPVDTVGLKANFWTDSKEEVSDLDLSRDLSMAIAEYAPGCEVVANGKLIKSRYVQVAPEKAWRDYDFIECPNCRTLNVDVHMEHEEGEKLSCKQCGEILNVRNLKTFIVPEFGFVAEKEVGKPSLIKPERNYRSEAAFISYNEKIPETSYQIGKTKIDIAIINDGPMAILNKANFWVCPECGYAKEADAKAAFMPEMEHKEKHITQTGKYCSHLDMQLRSLGYHFKTDVVRIRIHKPLPFLGDNHEEAYSILQALMLATCDELDIDYGEISGCLQYYKDPHSNYSYILFDKTPGGAGHVKRLNNEAILKIILQSAYDRCNNCNCDETDGDSSCYSCLRTYQNQKYHDILKRKYVVEYLKDLVN